MIKATNIHKTYGSLHVLNGIDLNINKSEIVAIVGASGAGKSTLLNIMGSLEKPDQGSVEIDGHSIFSLSERKLSAFRNKNIGFVFQFHHLLPEFTALENVCIPAMIAGTSKSEYEKNAKELLDLLGVSQRMHHKPSQMSGGEQQRIAVARALINKPLVVFADEPSGNLDSKNAGELHNLFFTLREMFYQTFVIVTHNNEFARMSDRILEMRDGSFI
jgi:lipoprotein-releasing system ATP-binding protein